MKAFTDKNISLKSMKCTCVCVNLKFNVAEVR